MPLRNEVDHGRAGHGIQPSTFRLRFGYRDRSGVDVGFVAGVVGEFELEG